MLRRAEEPNLAAQMRALADKTPEFADRLRSNAQAFEDAVAAFFKDHAHSPITEDNSAEVLRTWREARAVLTEATEDRSGLPLSHRK